MKVGSAVFLCACATVAQAQLFVDDFSRSTDPGPLTPWNIDAGNWSVTGGVLKAGANPTQSYGYAYVANSWTNYSVEARLRFSSTSAYGGGLGGRLNPACGAHYAAYVCPEGSPAGSKTLQIYKFQDWESIEFTNSSDQAIAIVNLANVGTNWHYLKLAFQANQISVFYDSNLVATVTDVESGFLGSGGITAELFTGATTYNMFVDDVVVSPLSSALMAANDAYFTTQNTVLNVAAAGILANDTKGRGTNLSALLATGPGKGTLNLNANGSFVYTPANNSTGVDEFTYIANDGSNASTPATVAIDVAPPGSLFFDDFTRSTPGNPFAPWIIGIGEWTITGGTLQGNATIPNNYSDAYVPLLVQDFSVQARIRMPANAWAGGLSGRINPATGARYVVNIYPDHSPLGPVNAMRLIKFSAWEVWSFTPMALVNLPSVGTNYHTLKLNFQGNQITVFYDGTQMINVADNLFDGTPAYTNGFFGAHMYMDAASITTFDDYTVTPLPSVNHPPLLPAQTNRTIAALSTLIVTNTATDSDLPVNTLSYTLASGPSGAMVDTNGIITWTPTQAQDLSTNTFTTVVTDFNPGSTNNQHLSATNSFIVFVNSRPGIVLDSSTLLQEGCSPANGALDPGESVIMSLAIRNIGPGVTTNLTVNLIPTNGIVVTGSAQTYGQMFPNGGPVSAPFSFAVNGACGSSVTALFQLQDGASNLGTLSLPLILGQVTTVITQGFDAASAPALPSSWSSSATGAESPWVTQSSANSTPPNCAFVPDALNVGVSDLVSPVFLLPNGPLQLTFANNYDLETNNNVQAFDGGVLEIKIGAGSFTDILAAGGNFEANGYTHSISTNFSNPLGGRRAWSGTSAGFVTTVVDLPPSAAGQNVQLRWRCATDNSNGRSGWRIDSIGISGRACCANTAPILASQPNRTIPELAQLIVTNTATDSSSSATNLTYTLVNSPDGASIDNNGIIFWIPSEQQGPGAYTITTVVSDNTSPPLSATNSFSVTVTEVNSAPILPFQPDRTIVELSPFSLTNQASDNDLPVNALNYLLINPPTGMTIDASGVIRWMPSESQGPSTNLVTTVVTDDGVPPLSATNSFFVTVTEVNSAPILPFQPDRTIVELSPFSLTNQASDADLPVNSLTYSLLNSPEGMIIDTNGVIRWTPLEHQGPSTNLITTMVTDDGVPPLSATNSFMLVVLESNSPPVLPSQSDLTVAELTHVCVTNTAIDFDIPSNILTYVLLNAPAGATISSNGIIRWTPGEDQGPGTNTITTVVTDNGVPPLSATNSFVMTVTEVNSAPILPFQPDRTVIGSQMLSVTNTATDSDIPPNNLSYVLIEAPTNAAIDAEGLITWTPAVGQFPSTNVFRTSVVDDGVPPLSATNEFLVVVQRLPAEPPNIESLILSNEVAILRWTSVPGYKYRLQYSDDLWQTNWNDSGFEESASGSYVTGTNLISGVAQRFYRVVLLP